MSFLMCYCYSWGVRISKEESKPKQREEEEKEDKEMSKVDERRKGTEREKKIAYVSLLDEEKTVL